ncbi:MAG: MSMEG_4193 family putative phosphomutase [Actinomycetota bacterium]
MLLFLIRHGLTSHTGVKLSGWTPGVHLSKEGRAQAARLVERMAGVPLDAMYASPLERTGETAEPLARARGLDVGIREELGEVHYGRIEGKTLRSLAKTPLWSQLRARPSDVRFPGGETLCETQARAVGAVEELRRDHAGKSVAVFSHGDWIRLALAHYAGVHIDLYRRLSVDPASVSVLQFYDGGVQVRRVNDCGDLSSVPLPAPATEKTATATATRGRRAR